MVGKKLSEEQNWPIDLASNASKWHSRGSSAYCLVTSSTFWPLLPSMLGKVQIKASEMLVAPRISEYFLKF